MAISVIGSCVSLVGYCMMFEIAQMALSYYLNKLRKDYFLKHHGRNDPESAARARGAICRTVTKRSNDSKRQTRVDSALKCVTRPGDFFMNGVRISDC